VAGYAQQSPMRNCLYRCATRYDAAPIHRLCDRWIGHLEPWQVTALVRALTGNGNDRLAEEKAVGLSDRAGFARFARWQRYTWT